MRGKAFLFPAMLALAACGQFPKDTEATSAHVAASGMKVGWVDGDRSNGDLQALVSALARASAKPPRIASGSAEPLLVQLEEGRLDLVVGTFDQTSPWAKRVTFSKPVSTHEIGKAKAEAKAAMRNGEHRWAMTVDKAVSELQGR